MMCMTTKKKFDVDEPEVRVLANGRYAYTAKCPWEGKNGKELVAFKFCSAEAYNEYITRSKSEHLEDSNGASESEHVE